MEKGDSFRVLEVIKSWILHCDAKAGLVLATDAVLFGFATTQVHGIADFLAADYSPHLKCLLIFLGLGFVITLFFSSVFSFKAIYPRLNVGEARSNIFFAHIAKKTNVDFLKEVNSMDNNAVTQDVQNQIHATSKVAWGKYQNVAISIRWLIGTGVLWLIIFLLTSALLIAQKNSKYAVATAETKLIDEKNAKET